MVTTADRNLLLDAVEASSADEQRKAIDRSAISALYERALWFDLAGGELQLRTRRGSAPPSSPVTFVAGEPTQPIPTTEEDSNG